MRKALGATLLLLAASIGARANRNGTAQTVPSPQSLFSSIAPPPKCPPCFNCRLPAFNCGQFGECSEYDGQCKCPPGWAGIDCLTPQCDSLADGEHRRPRDGNNPCECKDGWGGINCNVCQSDNACIGFPLAGGIGGLLGEGETTPANMTCYTGGETVFNNHQMCNVTNPNILEMLPGRPPQVTFSCDRSTESCAFQFWVDQVESFYCALDGCESSTIPGYNYNTTQYDCEKIKCSCVPGRFICGENGSIDISEFLRDEIKGPGSFSCRTGRGCKFEEPAMNELINEVFGDTYITLECQGGECLHYSQVPGYVRPPKPSNMGVILLSVAGVSSVALLTLLILWYGGGANEGGEFGAIRLPEAEVARLIADHVPASLYFSNISYSLPAFPSDSQEGTPASDHPTSSGPRLILDNISGFVKPGQIMAIMGASGAGKSTFLDILARKNKRGTVSGTTLVNGRTVEDSAFRNVVGFVDQEDTLMPTLTVYETVLYSALLRLPREMSIEAKKFRTLETLNELGILGIKDMRIGESGRRSISGGEKRRVSIACELVTSPSILFLDEPTSGLDAFNALSVVESLVSLARNYNRTVIFTIHQPRSNIVARFDQLILLAKGKLVYSGAYTKCQDYFKGIGKECPAGFNIADYLIDVTMQVSEKESRTPASVAGESTGSVTGHLGDEEQGLSVHLHTLPASVRSLVSESMESPPPGAPPTQPLTLPTQPGSSSHSSLNTTLKQKTSQLFDAVRAGLTGGSGGSPQGKTIAPGLQYLVDSYAQSDIAQDIKAEGERLRNSVDRSGDAPRDVIEETSELRGRKRASWATQFRILSGRAFKNLYRDPALLFAHYMSAIGLSITCGLFFHNVTNDIAGFQNRLGIFFFTLALFGFSCLSSLGLFANERILFMRERSNGYYSSFTYFASKILFDILPLRLVPPLMFGAIVYGLVGLVPTVAGFWKFMLTLVLFNLTTASVVLWLSVAFASTSVASLVGTLIMLFNLLFTGLLINRETVIPAFQWLHTVSFFHAAFEALAVNELRYLQLKEIKYGVELDVPAATILSIFGLRAQSFWWPNISLLAIFFVVFTTASYITLHFFVRERR